VTIPSQIRYVQYYGQIIRDKLHYEGVVLLLRAIELQSIPTFSGGVCSECLCRSNIVLINSSGTLMPSAVLAWGLVDSGQPGKICLRV